MNYYFFLKWKNVKSFSFLCNHDIIYIYIYPLQMKRTDNPLTPTSFQWGDAKTQCLLGYIKYIFSPFDLKCNHRARSARLLTVTFPNPCLVLEDFVISPSLTHHVQLFRQSPGFFLNGCLTHECLRVGNTQIYVEHVVKGARVPHRFYTVGIQANVTQSSDPSIF